MSKKRKKLNDTTKYLLIACFFLLSMDFLLGIVLTSQSRKAMTNLIRSRMLDAAKIAAASLSKDADALKSIRDDGPEEHPEETQAVLDSLLLFKNNMDMKYIYTIKYKGAKDFVFLIDSDPIDPGQYDEPVVFTNALFRAANEHVPTVDETPFTDRWGIFYSSYCPVFDSLGNLVCIVAVDYDAQWYDDLIAMNTASILIITVLSLLFGAFIIITIANRFTKKIHALYNEVTALSEEVETLNLEMAPPADFEANPSLWRILRKQKKPKKKDDLDSEEISVSHTVDAIGDKIRQTHLDVKQYVSYVREQDYTDPLTGVGNRTAYLELTRDIDLDITDKVANFSMALFDVNGLRHVNDEYGLKYGDQMIADVATLLLRVFDAADVFRIGSDEFVVLKNGTTLEELNASIEKLTEIVARFNAEEKTYEMTLSFTSGVAAFDAEQDHTCSDVFKKATKILSQNKALYYRQEGDRRKR